MIYVTMKAYNAEATLRRAVESILSQSFGDFRFHLCDNGSEDGTRDLIREYARLDRRVVPFFNRRNMEWTAESARNVRDMMFHLEPEDWFSVLDADDDYEPDFLEEMLRFAEENRLDFAACRSNHIREPEGRTCNEFVLERDIIIGEADFGPRFPDYFRFMGAKWGKLQKGELFQRMDQKALEQWLREQDLSHRHDTATQLYYLRYSRRMGVRAKLLHNYHLYPVSHSTQNLASKERDNLKMPEIYRAFLREKSGTVSEKNEAYIQELFRRSQRRTAEQRGKGNGKG